MSRPRGTPYLSLVMPLFNEAGGVTAVVGGLCRILHHEGLSFEIILVDNGSTDGTLQAITALAESEPALKLLHLPQNQGYGGGILEGLSLARGDIRGWLWGDEQIPAYAVLKTLALLEGSRLDMAKVRRVDRQDGWRRKLLSRGYHALLPQLTALTYDDLHGCPKLFRQEALSRLNLQSRDWFLDFEAMVKATTLGLTIGEVPITAGPRKTGRSKVRLGTVLEFMLNLSRYRLGRGPFPPPRM